MALPRFTLTSYPCNKNYYIYFTRTFLPLTIKKAFKQKNKRELSRILSLVAGEGIEPPAFGL